jgi:hypothetical protein
MNKEPITSRKLLTSMVSSEAYRATFNGVDLRNMDEVGKLYFRSQALGAAALQRANENTRESGYKTPEGHLYSLMTQYDSFIASHHKLDYLQSHDTTREQKLPALQKAVDFNTTLRELIDAGGSPLTVGTLSTTLAETFQHMHGSEDLPYFMGEIRKVLIGMRHEIGFEQIVATMPDVEYEHATPVEDVYLGIDIKLKYRGTPIDTDVKASALSAKKANENNWHQDKLHIWSQLNDSDFGNGFHIPTKLAEEKARDVRAILDDTLPWINSRSA